MPQRASFPCMSPATPTRTFPPNIFVIRQVVRWRQWFLFTLQWLEKDHLHYCLYKETDFGRCSPHLLIKAANFDVNPHLKTPTTMFGMQIACLYGRRAEDRPARRLQDTAGSPQPRTPPVVEIGQGRPP